MEKIDAKDVLSVIKNAETPLTVETIARKLGGNYRTIDNGNVLHQVNFHLGGLYALGKIELVTVGLDAYWKTSDRQLNASIRAVQDKKAAIVVRMDKDKKTTFILNNKEMTEQDFASIVVSLVFSCAKYFDMTPSQMWMMVEILKNYAENDRTVLKKNIH